jgi:hypothetical protein
MSNRDMIDQIFHRLAHAPLGLDRDYGEVLIALGRLASAILAVSSSDAEDRQNRTDWFCQALQIGAKRNPATVSRH